MTSLNIAQQRLHNQHIAQTSFKQPGEVVRWLGAVQAQDYPGALWSLGLRLPNSTETEIEQAIAAKTIVRTWPMRGTLHFVAPEDVRWMLALLTPRIIAKSAKRHEQLSLNEALFARGKELFAQALQGGKQLTRAEMMAVLEQADISTEGQRGYHILGWLAQTGFICFGPMRAKQQTFVLLDEWLPEGKKLTRDESLAELTRRYFTGHGPATLQDFMWWTGLTAADARAGLEMVKPQLAQEVVAGQTYWISQNRPALPHQPPEAYLLPGFDEYLLGYTDRSAALDPGQRQLVHPGNNGIFSPTIVLNGRVAGLWRRTFKKDKVVLSLTPFNPLTEAERQVLNAAAERYGKFVNRPVSMERF